jgi:hypothetical protein
MSAPEQPKPPPIPVLLRRPAYMELVYPGGQRLRVAAPEDFSERIFAVPHALFPSVEPLLAGPAGPEPTRNISRNNLKPDTE